MQLDYTPYLGLQNRANRAPFSARMSDEFLMRIFCSDPATKVLQYSIANYTNDSMYLR
jgi:hypothetical protein